MKTDQRYMLSKLGVFDMKEFMELFMKKELKHNDSFTKTNETFKKSSVDIDILLNDDTWLTIIKENEEKEKQWNWMKKKMLMKLILLI